MLFELCLVFKSLGLEAEQGAGALGLKVKRRAAFGCPGPGCQSLLSSRSCPQRSATLPALPVHQTTNTEQDNRPRAGGLNVANADLFTGFYASGSSGISA